MEWSCMDYRYITIVYGFSNQSLCIIHDSSCISPKIVDFSVETTTILMVFRL